MIGAREMNVQLATRGIESADTAASGPLALQSKGQHGDRVPVSEPWMPPNGGTPWLQGRVLRGRGGPQKPAFCETKPFVMLKKTHLYDSERMGCADYRKMTNGFVFLEMRTPERTRTRLTRTFCPKERNRSKCMRKTRSFS